MGQHNPNEIGRALEDSVRTIETTILRSAPHVSEGTFQIEGRKVLNVNGVHHEIDIHVSVGVGAHYRSVFIFECKNWEAKVNKNEIVVFSEKIKAANAQQGFFVARSYTADAIAQANLDPRIELLTFSDLDPAILTVPSHFHVLYVGDPTAAVEIRATGAPADAQRRQVDMEAVTFSLSGVAQNFREYIVEWLTGLREQRTSRFSSAFLPDGEYNIDFDEERQFGENEALVNHQPIERIQLSGTIPVEVRRPIITSAMDVATRGRVINTQVVHPKVSVGASFVAVYRPA